MRSRPTCKRKMGFPRPSQGETESLLVKQKPWSQCTPRNTHSWILVFGNFCQTHHIHTSIHHVKAPSHTRNCLEKIGGKKTFLNAQNRKKNSKRQTIHGDHIYKYFELLVCHSHQMPMAMTPFRLCSLVLFLSCALVAESKFMVYKTGQSVVPGKLNVHLVPHTHNDVGWRKTVDQYYVGSNYTADEGCVENILDSLIPALLANKNRRFIYVEQAPISFSFLLFIFFRFLAENWIEI